MKKGKRKSDGMRKTNKDGTMLVWSTKVKTMAISFIDWN